MCSWPRGVNYGKQDKNGQWGEFFYQLNYSLQLTGIVEKNLSWALTYTAFPLCILWRNVEKTAGKISPTKVLSSK
jgi:hypothetical protein